MPVARDGHAICRPELVAGSCPGDGVCPPTDTGRSNGPPDRRGRGSPRDHTRRDRFHRTSRRGRASCVPEGPRRCGLHHPPHDRREADARMTAPNELRLLPWSGPEGKPCYLSTDDQGGYMSRLADNIEAVQLGTAAELLEQAAETLDDQEAGPE